MTEDPDPIRLKALEARLARVKGTSKTRGSATGLGFSQGELAWRMVIELVSGMLIGLGIGFGLDWLFGTRPIFLILFVLLGFAAGVKTMLRTAQSMTVSPAQDGNGAPAPERTGPARAAVDGDENG